MLSTNKAVNEKGNLSSDSTVFLLNRYHNKEIHPGQRKYEYESGKIRALGLNVCDLQ
jgi:hypothetical protein